MYLHKYAKGHKLELVYLWSYTVDVSRHSSGFSNQSCEGGNPLMRAFLYYVIQIIPDHATNLFTDHEEIYARLVKAIWRTRER